MHDQPLPGLAGIILVFRVRRCGHRHTHTRRRPVNPSTLIRQCVPRTPRTLSRSAAAHPLPALSLRLLSSPRPPRPKRKRASGHPPRESSKGSRDKPKIFLVGGHQDYFFLVGHCKIIIIVITIMIIITIHMLYRNLRFVCILLCIIH